MISYQDEKCIEITILQNKKRCQNLIALVDTNGKPTEVVQCFLEEDHQGYSKLTHKAWAKANSQFEETHIEWELAECEELMPLSMPLFYCTKLKGHIGKHGETYRNISVEWEEK